MKNSGGPCLTNKAMKGEPKDRISNLPSHVLENILERLPLRDAIRTCILSRRWRYSWASLSKLCFDAKFCDWVLRKGFNSRRLASVITEILFLHKGPILDFLLCAPEESVSSFIDHIDKWMLFLSRNGVEVLNLFGPDQDLYHLGSSLFSCSKLTHLRLDSFIFEPPSSFNGFQYLTSLALYIVSIKSNVLEALISSATLLENLALLNCPDIDIVNIRASNLKYLKIEGAFKSITLTNPANLVEAHLCVHRMGNNPVHQKSNLIEVYGSMPRIKKLALSDLGFGIFTADGIPTKLPTELIKHLILWRTTFSQADEFACALRLIRSLPNLQKLGILSPIIKFVGVDTSIVETHFEGFTLDKLEIVSMMGIMGSSPELDLIKCFLASAPRLVTMFVRCRITIARAAMVTLSRALMRFPRASPKAKVEYLEPVYGD